MLRSKETARSGARSKVTGVPQLSMVTGKPLASAGPARRTSARVAARGRMAGSVVRGWEVFGFQKTGVTRGRSAAWGWRSIRAAMPKAAARLAAVSTSLG